MAINIEDTDLHIPAAKMTIAISSVPKVVTEAFVIQGGSWKSFYKNVIAKELASTTNAVIQDLFTADEWASTTPKLVTIPVGQTIGSNDNTLPALKTGTGGGGIITIENLGEIQGAGGTANGGTGGTAFNAEQAISFINSGAVRAGGGGGGIGGVGGSGSYSSSVREPTSGDAYSASTVWSAGGDGSSTGAHGFYWQGVIGWTVFPYYNNTSHVVGSYTYHRGAFKGNFFDGGEGTYNAYGIYRTATVSVYSTGGAGGAGGRGVGFDGALVGGSAGSAGGTNAGAGGTGGTGGAWGTTGATGATGAAGNNGAGVAGAAGGLAGFSYQNTTNITLIDNGTSQGRTA